MARVIKRYENRKMYDTEKRAYISLEAIAQLIRDDVDIQVIDNVTGKDITTHTLTQVIFEEGKKGRNPLSNEMLHDVIRWGNSMIDDGIKQVREGIDSLMPESLTRIFDKGSKSDMGELKKRIESLENAIDRLSKKTKDKEPEKSGN
jgi:polyhydroxyalkanoate synthesis repressor PhaR